MVLGVALGWAYYAFPRARESAAVQWGTLALILLAGRLCLAPSSPDADGPASYGRYGLDGLIFLGATLCHIPAVVYILVSQWNRLLEHLTSPGSTSDREKEKKPRSPEEEWVSVERHLEALRLDPVDAHQRHQLGECYLRLGLTDSALGEFRRAIECLERGYEEAYLLFKCSRLLIDHKRDVRQALPVLRRIIRVYPRSYFAAYARRVVNQYEAHTSRWS